MKVISSNSNVLMEGSPNGKMEVDPGSLIQTYDFNEYIKSMSFLDQGEGGYFEPGGVSNLQISPEIKDMLKEKFWRAWYHLKHVQAGPFAVYNNPTPIDVNGLFPASSGEVGGQPGQFKGELPPGVPVATTQALVGAGAIAPSDGGAGQVQFVPGVGPAYVTPQMVTEGQNPSNQNEEVNKSLDTRAIPTNLPVTASAGGDPNSPPLANIPVVNVIGGKTISAPGVIPSEVMERHPLFSSNSLQPTNYFKINVENVGRTLIVVVIIVFLILGCVYRIKTRKKGKKKR